jgi:hypothetical protein
VEAQKLRDVLAEARAVAQREQAARASVISATVEQGTQLVRGGVDSCVAVLAGLCSRPAAAGGETAGG